MQTDERLIEALRVALREDRHEPPGDLMQRIQSRAGRPLSRRRWSPRVSGGALAVAGSLAVTLIVAALAVILLGHGRSPGQRAASHPSPQSLARVPAGTLFRANAEWWNQDNHNHPPPDGVIQSTVRRAAILTIPQVGQVEYWVAHTRNGKTCEAFKLPDGTWAGMSQASSARYNFGGSVPGCSSSHDGGTGLGGGLWFIEDSFGPAPRVDRHYVRDMTFVVFGTVDVSGAAQVRDPVTDRTAPVIDHDFFALVEPQNTKLAKRPQGLRFQALSAAGTVLSTSWTNQHILRWLGRNTPGAKPPGPTLAEVIALLRCPACHAPLTGARSPQANAERLYVQHLFKNGDSEVAILRTIRATYGPSALTAAGRHVLAGAQGRR